MAESTFGMVPFEKPRIIPEYVQKGSWIRYWIVPDAPAEIGRVLEIRQSRIIEFDKYVRRIYPTLGEMGLEIHGIPKDTIIEQLEILDQRTTAALQLAPYKLEEIDEKNLKRDLHFTNRQSLEIQLKSF